jgi:hypothetical protein
MGKLARALLEIAGRSQISAPIASNSKKATSITVLL